TYQAEVPDDPGPSAMFLRSCRLLRARFRLIGNRGVQLVLKQKPCAPVFLDGRIVATMESRRGQDEYPREAQAEALDQSKEHRHRTAAHQDRGDVEDLVGDGRAGEGEQAREDREKQLIDVAGVEDRR